MLFSNIAAATELNIYSHRQPFLIDPFLKAFTEKTGIKTNVPQIKIEVLLLCRKLKVEDLCHIIVGLT